MLSEIRQLFEFNSWANHRYLDAVATLDQEEFTRDLRSSFPSIKATMQHILGAEWIWLERWEGVSPTDTPDEWDLSSAETLRAEWGRIEARQLHFLGRLSDSRLLEIVAYRNLAGIPYANPLWQLMRHVVNHSTYHRGQVATMLRQLGKAAPATDLIVFFREHA